VRVRVSVKIRVVFRVRGRARVRARIRGMTWVWVWVRTKPIAHCVASAKARGSAAAVTVMLVPPSSGPLVGLSAKVDGAAKKATLKTADGVFPVAVEAPEAGRRLWSGGGSVGMGGFLMASGGMSALHTFGR